MDQVLLLDRSNRELCTRILRLVTISFRPLILKKLVVMAELSSDMLVNEELISELIELYGSFIILRERTVLFVHQSAKEYFTCNDQTIFPSSIRNEHGRIVHLSLNIMSSQLEMDVYRLKKPGTLAKAAVINRSIKCSGYSCCFWVDYLVAYSQGNSYDISIYCEFLIDYGNLIRFLVVYLLYWFEVLSLAERIPAGILAIINLETLILVSLYYNTREL
jgi:hypothetical protein